MREDQALGPDQRQLFDKLLVAHVQRQRLVVDIGLRNEQIGIASQRDQAVGPLGVAAIGEHLAVHGDAVAVVAVARRTMAHQHGQDLGTLEHPRLVGRELDERNVEAFHRSRRALESDVHQARKPRLQSGRSGDRERAGAPARKLRVEQKERHAAGVIGMKMGEQNEIDRIAVDSEPVHGDQRGGAAIDQKICFFADHVKASIEPPARTEGIPTPNKLQMHPVLRNLLGHSIRFCSKSLLNCAA